jgi:hypothetical protein
MTVMIFVFVFSLKYEGCIIIKNRTSNVLLSGVWRAVMRSSFSLIFGFGCSPWMPQKNCFKKYLNYNYKLRIDSGILFYLFQPIYKINHIQKNYCLFEWNKVNKIRLKTYLRFYQCILRYWMKYFWVSSFFTANKHLVPGYYGSYASNSGIGNQVLGRVTRIFGSGTQTEILSDSGLVRDFFFPVSGNRLAIFSGSGSGSKKNKILGEYPIPEFEWYAKDEHPQQNVIIIYWIVWVFFFYN